MGQKMDQLMVYDGSTSWLYDRVKKSATKLGIPDSYMNVHEERVSPSGSDPLSSDPVGLAGLKRLEYTISEKKEGGRDYYVLTSKGAVIEGPQSIDRVELWLDKETKLPLRLCMDTTMSVPTQSGQPPLVLTTRGAQEFSNWQFDKGLSEEIFTFTPPEGIEVTDQSQILADFYRLGKEKAERAKSVQSEANRDKDQARPSDESGQ